MFFCIENLSKSYGDKVVVSDINLSMEQGELLCLLGASGSGKSTILKAIGGFIDIDSGSIRLEGREISGLDASEREVATVFQSYGLLPHMSVIDNVAYGLKLKGIKKAERLKQAEEFLELIRLPEAGHKKISELSGGEQQRVALARSLILKPKLLLLDEPLSNIDAKLRQSMRQEIRRIHKEFNISTIFVTHDQEEAFELADNIALLESGRLIEKSSPSRIYTQPGNMQSLKFIGEANIIGDTYVRPEDIHISEEGEEFTIMQKTFKGAYSILNIENDKYSLNMLLINSDYKLYNIGDRIRVIYNVRRIGDD